MSLPHQTNLVCFISYRSDARKLDHGPGSIKKSDTCISLYEDKYESKEQIKKMFKEADLSVSSYDTAWMSMVPRSSVNPHQAATPQFPSCLNWVLNNQLSDGSWGRSADRDKILTMDAISATLACVVALKQWGTGEAQINKGLEFIATNSSFVNDDKQRKPIGFDIVFPSMIEQAKSLNLNIPVRQGDLDALFKRRNLELARFPVWTEGRRAYLLYVSEGVGMYQDWEMAIKYQRKNGSLLNSPSATAAAYSHVHDPDCLRYLNLLLADTFGDAVPAIHPQAKYTKLWMVDNLEKLGIHHHFKEEIENVLEETYRCWVQGEEEIFEDTTTCAMAFRILRWHGYDVSSDALRRFGEEDCFRNTLEGYLRETGPVLELYKASQIVIHQDELILEHINPWTSNLLNGCLKHDSEEGLGNKYLSKEVEHALLFPYYKEPEQLANMRNIENYRNMLGNSRLLKTAVSSCVIGNKDFLSLAAEEFNKCQLIHQQELKHLERWVVEKGLHKLKFARQKQAYCYFTGAASIPTPELSDARMSWAKNAILATVIDDLFDVGGSMEDLQNLIQLISKHGDVDIRTECCSEDVKILYSALRSTIVDLGDKSFAWQGRCLKGHMTETWLALLKAELNEATWSREKLVPTMPEFIANGLLTFALGPVTLLTLYFVRPQLSEDEVQSPELKQLFELVSTYARLMNDIASQKRDKADGNLNSVMVQMMHTGAEEEEAIKEMKRMMSTKTREILRRCIFGEGEEGSSVIPRECRELFWKLYVVANFMYIEDENFSSDDIINVVKTMFQQPM